ncbi:MAG: rod shape-determining protein MreC [Patescibacteria group bacterium]
MKSIRIFIASFLLLVLALLFIFYHQNINIFLKGFRNFSRSFFDRSFSYGNLKDLEVENQQLKATLALLKQKNEKSDEKKLITFVYSNYPFNDNGLLIINAGSKDGVKEMMPVVSLTGALIGRISAVKNNLSEVQTIFSPDFRSSVVIGNSRTKAVLRGGNIPYLEFVQKTAKINDSDGVFNISSEYPFNLFLGNIHNLVVTPQDSWLKTEFTPAYSVNDLDKVVVILNFP